MVDAINTFLLLENWKLIHLVEIMFALKSFKSIKSMHIYFFIFFQFVYKSNYVSFLFDSNICTVPGKDPFKPPFCSSWMQNWCSSSNLHFYTTTLNFYKIYHHQTQLPPASSSKVGNSVSHMFQKKFVLLWHIILPIYITCSLPYRLGTFVWFDSDYWSNW